MIPYLAKELWFCAIHDKHIYLKLQIIQWLKYTLHIRYETLAGYLSCYGAYCLC